MFIKVFALLEELRCSEQTAGINPLGFEQTTACARTALQFRHVQSYILAISQCDKLLLVNSTG